MWSFRSSFLGLSGLVALLALAGTACHNDGAAPNTALLTQAQADSVGEELAYDADDEISGAAMNGDASYAAAAPVVAAAPPQCVPTRSPASPGDADADGVPDSVRFDFTGCVISYPLQTDTLRGTVALVDPTKNVADHALERIFTDLALVRLFIGGRWTSETRNGIRTTNRDSSTLTNTETNLRTDFVYRDGTTASHVKTWMSTFTADVPGSIQKDQLLPSGNWSIGGTSSWTRGARTYAITATTNPPLHYNASCTDFPRFDAGTLTAVVTRNGQTVNLVVTFTACGAAGHTVTRS